MGITLRDSPGRSNLGLKSEEHVPIFCPAVEEPGKEARWLDLRSR